MKVIVKESLGLEYVWDVISSCDQNGIQAIADNQNNEILFYDPKNKQYCTNKDLMNADYSIHDVFTDKSAREQVMKPTTGQGFEEFATKWDALQKSDDPDIIKTKNCSMIRFSANEGNKTDSAVVYWKDKSKRPMVLKNVRGLEDAFEDIRYTLSHEPGDIADIDHIKIGSKVYDREDIDDYLAHEHELEELDSMYSENIDDMNDWSATEDEVEVQWMIDDKELGIESGDIETVVIDLDLVDCFEELVYQVELALEKAHGGMRFDYDDEWILVDEVELIKRFGCSMSESESNGRTLDDSNDWSASEGEVEIVWTTDFPEYQIEVGDTDHFVVDFDVVLPNDYDIESNCLKEEVCRLIRKEYPGIDVAEYDFDITNEREFWGNQADSRIYPYDESEI